MTKRPALAAIDASDVLQWRRMADELDVELGQNGTERRRTSQAVWLSAYAASFDRSTACDVAGISAYALKSWASDETFRALRELADERIRETIAGEVYRRAVIGVEQGVWHQGKLVGTETKLSDRMLELLAKRIDPAWRESSTSVAIETSSSVIVQRILADPTLRALAVELADRAALPGATEPGESRKVVDVESVEARPAGSK